MLAFCFVDHFSHHNGQSYSVILSHSDNWREKKLRINGFAWSHLITIYVDVNWLADGNNDFFS